MVIIPVSYKYGYTHGSGRRGRVGFRKDPTRPAGMAVIAVLRQHDWSSDWMDVVGDTKAIEKVQKRPTILVISSK